MFKRAQLGIGYLAQEASVFRKLSVEDNILGCTRNDKAWARKTEQSARLRGIA